MSFNNNANSSSNNHGGKIEVDVNIDKPGVAKDVSQHFHTDGNSLTATVDSSKGSNLNANHQQNSNAGLQGQQEFHQGQQFQGNYDNVSGVPNQNLGLQGSNLSGQSGSNHQSQNQGQQGLEQGQGQGQFVQGQQHAQGQANLNSNVNSNPVFK